MVNEVRAARAANAENMATRFARQQAARARNAHRQSTLFREAHRLEAKDIDLGVLAAKSLTNDMEKRKEALGTLVWEGHKVTGENLMTLLSDEPNFADVVMSGLAVGVLLPDQHAAIADVFSRVQETMVDQKARKERLEVQADINRMKAEAYDLQRALDRQSRDLDRAAGSVERVARPWRAKTPPDPPIVIDRSDPVFEYQPIARRNKLRQNSLLHSDDAGRLARVVSRTGGTAAQNLTAKVAPGSPPEILMAEDVSDSLGDMLEDYHNVPEARRSYRELMYELGDDYHIFFAEFIRLARTAIIHKTWWKIDLHEKLPPSIQRAVGRSTYDDLVSFDEYREIVQDQVFVENHVYKSQEVKMAKPTRGVPAATTVGSARASATTAANPTHSNTVPRSTPNQFTAKSKASASRAGQTNERRWFSGDRLGHHARDRPDKSVNAAEEASTEPTTAGLKKKVKWAKIEDSSSSESEN